MRLFAAAMVFYALALTFGSAPWRDHMVGAVSVAAAVIPIRVVVASIEIADSLTGGKILGSSP